MSPWAADWFVVGMAAGAVGMFGFTLWIVTIRGWRHATFSGAPLPLPMILGMRLRGSPVDLIVDTHVALRKRGHDIEVQLVEKTYLANRSERMDVMTLVSLVERHLRRSGGSAAAR